MKTQYIRNIPVNNEGGEIVCFFTGTISWQANMSPAIISAGKFEFDNIDIATTLNTSKLMVDENGRGEVFCLYY